MSALAFTAQGDTFDVPETVEAWRVRRLRQRGAPELVYGRDGLPLTVPIEFDIAMLRDAVGGVLDRYRLDPLDVHGKVIEDVPIAYVQVVAREPEPEPVPPPNGPYAAVRCAPPMSVACLRARATSSTLAMMMMTRRTTSRSATTRFPRCCLRS